MKTITFGLLLLALALPATAFEKGDCCASVNDICVSICKKISCTAESDCEMVGDRPDPEPGEGGLAAPGGDSSPKPVLIQTGGTSAQVPMKHGSCGLDCGTHVLAVASGNLDVPFKISMNCPAGTRVKFLAYAMQGQEQVTVVDGATPSSSYSEDLDLQPFSTADLEESCRVALGGNWPLPGSHQNLKPKEVANLQEPVTVWGQCTGWPDKAKRAYSAKLRLSCEDQSWFAPLH